ncbi:MAG: hypothetical protein QOH91_4754 [Mycobacterium sp.]|nr:hypothetical protein [Mycobacterium sp.]
MRPRRIAPILVWLVVCGGVGVASPASAGPVGGSACRPAELFASDNTADELGLFEIPADVTLALNGAAVTGSTLIDGVFWSDQLQQTTAERSREFHLCVADEPTLHTAAAALRSQFDQEAVLTFDYLPQHEANAVIITVPDIDIARFRDAFVAASAARHRLLGGSVTTTDHTLILIAGNSDLDIARRLVGEAGGCWGAATIAYGKRDLVT